MVEVAKWLTRGVVAPLFVGSIPILHPKKRHNYDNSRKLNTV